MVLSDLFFQNDTPNVIWYLTKAFSLLLLVCVITCIAFIKKKISAGDERWRRWLTFFGAYGLLLAVIMLILWPGTWSWDDALNLGAERAYGTTEWHHVLTGLFHQTLMQFLPFPGGIVLLQNVLIAGVVAYFIVTIENTFHIPGLRNKYLDIIVKLLPFLLPPVIFYQFSGYRLGVYIYAELFMLAAWINAVYAQKLISGILAVTLSVLASIVSVWRTESFFYIPFVCLSLLLIKKEVLRMRMKILCVVIIVGLSLVISHFQNALLGDDSYKLVSIIRQCTELVRASDEYKDRDVLEDISQAIDVDVIWDNPDCNGENLYWHHNVIRKGNTKLEYERCMSGFIRLCFRYPHVVIMERMKLFLSSINVTGGVSDFNLRLAYSFYDDDTDNVAAIAVRDAGYFANRPVFDSLRKHFLHLMIFQYGDHKNKVLFKVFWSAALPILALGLALIRAVRDDKRMAVILLAVVIRIPVVILTEPARWIMYFLSFYLLGYVVVVYYLLCKNNKRNSGVSS